MASPPSPTLFVQNLNDKIKKDELRRTLYCLFATYGKVLDVVHTRDPKVRGTAFVVFRDLASSTSALRGLDGEGFFGKQLRISYAKGVSHATISLNEGPEAVYAIKAGLRTASEKKVGLSKMTVSSAQNKQMEDGKKAKRGREVDEEEEEEDSDEDMEEGPDKKKGKAVADDDDDAMEEDSDEETPVANGKGVGPAAAAQGDEPNPILFIEGLPLTVTDTMLYPLFQQFPGLSSLKLLPTPAGSESNTGIAFVQYETTGQAGTAKDALDGFMLSPEAKMAVNYAKRA